MSEKLYEIFNQETMVASPVSENLFVDTIRAALSSEIFKELINKEKEAIKVTVIMEVIE